VLAQWKILPGRPRPLIITPVQPVNFSADSTSKEYIYAGSRLIATEEPQIPTAANPASPSIEYVIWRRPSGVSCSPGALTKTSPISGWNAGASSTRALAGDGYFEFTVPANDKDVYVGLNNADLDYSYAEIDYGIYLTNYGGIAVYQFGTTSGIIGNYVAGDRLRIATSGNVIHFLKNGTEFYSLGLAAAYPLAVDSTLATTGASITNAMLSGTLIDAAVTENVIWTNAVGVLVSDNSLTKTGTTAGWNAGASSTKAIASGDGFVEFTATETNMDRMLGLNNGDAGQSYAEIKYGIYLTNYGGYAVYHSGISSGLLGNYSSGDVFRISIDNGAVRFSRNGAVFYTSSVAPAYPLKVDTTMATPGSTITNVIISGNLTP
jgi:hypothetical protein